jgi:hypothetical protein
MLRDGQARHGNTTPAKWEVQVGGQVMRGPI